MLLKIKKGMGEKKGEQVKVGHNYRQLIVTLIISTTLLNYGLQSGWISPMKKVLQSDNSPSGSALTDSEMSWVASTMALAAMVGTSLYAYLADAYGRKLGVIALIVPQALCWIIKLVSSHTVALIISRICAGLPAGGCFNLVPMYINEISQENCRGAMVALAMTFTNIGYLIMYAMGGYMEYYMVLWVVGCIPIAALILFMIVVPESPAYLVKKGKIEDATKVVAKLRGLEVTDSVVIKEINYMQNQEENFKNMKTITLRTILKNKAWVRGIMLCMFNLTALDLNGTFSINTYALTIMTQSGVTVNPELQTLSIPTILIFGSLVSMSCVEKFGRKRILVGGFSLSAVSLACLATTLLLQKHSDIDIPSWLPVLSIVVSVWLYSAAVMPIIYVVLSEIFTFQVRAKLLGLIVTYAWFVSFIQVYTYLPLTSAFGMHTTFYLFAGVNLIGAVTCLIFQPETMGKNVEEIEQILLGKSLN